MMEQKHAEPRRFDGIWIGADLWLDRSLSITEKVLLVEINSLDASDRGCYASNARFAEFFDLSPSRVSEIIKSLESRGRISITYIRAGRQIVERQIRMIGRRSNPPDGVFGKPKGGYSENTDGGIRKNRIGYSENTEERSTYENNNKRDKSMANKSPSDSAPPAVRRVTKAEQSRLDGIALMMGYGVEEQHAADLMTNRKGDPMTITAWERLCKQAAEVGMTPAEGVEYAAGAGWKSFTAQYFRNATGATQQQGGARVGGKQTLQQQAAAGIVNAVKRFEAERLAGGRDYGDGFTGETFDV